MTQTVISQDGMVNNFPDEATPEMMAFALKIAPPSSSFTQRVSQDYQNRLKEGQQAADAYVSDAQSLPLTYLDFAGKVGAGTGADIIGEGIKSAASYAPQDVKDAVSSAVHYIANSPAGDAARFVGNKYEDLAQRYPNAIRHVEAAANIGGLLAPEIPFKGTSIANTAMDAAQGGLKAAKTGINAAQDLTVAGLQKAPALDEALGKTIRPTQEDLTKASQANYARVAKSGEQLSPSFTNSFIDHAQSFSVKDPMASKIAGNSPLAGLASDLEGFRNQPMDLQRAEAVDQALTDRLEDPAFTDKNGVLNRYGHQLLQIKENLRNSLLNAPAKGQISNNIKGASGISAYFDAVKDWAAKSQMNEIQRIIDRASYMDNSATALKTGFRNIAVNPGRLSKFPTEVQGAIKSASKDGDLANILRTELGSRLISSMIGAAAGSVGGPLGALVGAGAGALTSRAARSAAENMQMGRVNKVMESIAGQSSLGVKKIPLSQIISKKKN